MILRIRPLYTLIYHTRMYIVYDFVLNKIYKHIYWVCIIHARTHENNVIYVGTQSLFSILWGFHLLSQGRALLWVLLVYQCNEKRNTMCPGPCRFRNSGSITSSKSRVPLIYSPILSIPFWRRGARLARVKTIIFDHIN